MAIRTDFAPGEVLAAGDLNDTFGAKLNVGAGGKVLQVVTTIKTDRFTTSSGTFVDITGYSATITPSAASSKILVVSAFHFCANEFNAHSQFVLLRASTQIGVGAVVGTATSATATSFSGSSVDSVANVGYNILDSPNTTSATTYKWQVKGNFSRQTTFNGSQNTTAVQQTNTSSTIILMEIAA